MVTVNMKFRQFGYVSFPTTHGIAIYDYNPAMTTGDAS